MRKFLDIQTKSKVKMFRLPLDIIEQSIRKSKTKYVTKEWR